MKTKLPHLERRFQRHLNHTATDLPRLESEIEHIGGAAHAALQHRLQHVEVMERALRRNFSEVCRSQDRPPAPRVRKLRQLCRWIERESDDLHHEVDFLAMGSGSTLVALVDGSNSLLERWFKRLTLMASSQRQRS